MRQCITFLVLFSVGIYILSNPGLTNYHLDYANALLISFGQHFGELYGKKYSISYKVHNLVHLTGDVRRHGVLENSSTFKFENLLQKLKIL